MTDLEKIKAYLLTDKEKAAITAACMSTEMHLTLGVLEDGDTKAFEVSTALRTGLIKVLNLQKELETGAKEYERRMN